MSDFNVTKQDTIFPKNGNYKRFDIKNDLLLDCIGLGRANGNQNRVVGFNSGKHLGYVLLAYFTSITLGFRRLPFSEDRIYTSNLSKSDYDRNLIANLSTETVDDVCSELHSLYTYTQKCLTQAGLTHVSLRREIKSLDDDDKKGYAETFYRYYVATTQTIAKSNH